jgi:hypothetical protein
LAVKGDISILLTHFHSLDLTEEKLLVTIGFRPIFKELACGFRYANITAFPPNFNGFPDAVDEFILFNSVLGPFGLKRQLGLFAFFLGGSDGNEIGAFTPEFYYFIGYSFISKAEMSGGLFKSRVDNRVFYDYLFHWLLLIGWLKEDRKNHPLVDFLYPQAGAKSRKIKESQRDQA